MKPEKTKEDLQIEIDQLKSKIAEFENTEFISSTCLDNSPVCTKIVDLDFNLQYMSNAGIRALHIDDISAYYGKPYPLSFFPDAYRITMSKNLLRAKETGETILQEGEILDIKGNKLWFQATITPVHNKQGQIDHIMVVSIDTSASKQLEELRSESEKKYRELVNLAQEGIWVIDKHNATSFVNPSMAKMLGYSADEMEGESLFDFMDEAGVKIANENLERRHAGIKDQHDFEFICKNGDRMIASLVTAPIMDMDGNYDGAIAGVMNITKRKQAERRYFKMFENMNAGVAIYLPVENGNNFIFLDFNRAAERITNTLHNKVIGKTLLSQFPNMNKTPLFKALQKVNETNKDLFLPAFYYKDGEREGWRENYIYKLSTGEIVAIFDDVSVLKNDEIKLKNKNKELIVAKEKAEESETRYRLLHENAGIGIGYFSPDGIIISFNTIAAKDMNGVPKDFEGKSIFDIFPKAITTSYFERIQKAIKSDKIEIYEDFIPLPTQGKWFLSTYVKIANSNKEVLGIQIISQDITKIKQFEIELIAAKEHAEESDLLKSAFLANMSHEIRTPMNGILGFAELLRGPGLTGEEQQQYIGIIEKGGARMLNIINDIIGISKIESGQMEVNMQESNINEQIEYIYTFFKPEIEGKGMQFSFSNSLPSSEAILKTDREKVYAILTNLVKNAIKYTSEGSIEFGYNKKDNYLEFFTKDTGVGIPKDRQEAIFERFIQADITDKNACKGAGLGLSISKAFVEMLGGQIWVESEVGKGSCFYFTLPYQYKTIKGNGEKNEIFSTDEVIPINKLKILIAEDDESSEKLISIYINEFSDDIISVKSGTEAVSKCFNNPDIDLVLMDIQMPEMDGYEATRQIRKFNKDVIIIAQTAYAIEGDKEKAMVAGCDDYIAKPIKADELKRMIVKYIDQ